MEFFKFAILSLSLFFTAATGALQSNLSSYGSDFYVAFLDHVHGSNNLDIVVQTTKSSSVDFSISSPHGFTYSGTTSVDSPNTVYVPLDYQVIDTSYSNRKKGLHVTSLATDPISLILYSERGSADYMGYHAQPCHTQPVDKYVYYTISSLGWSNRVSQFVLVGCRNNTNITITTTQSVIVPTDPQISGSPTFTLAPDTEYKIMLHASETLLVSVAYADLTGSKIVSDRPLTVVSGHEASRIPAGASDADPISTQIPPTVTWGKKFFLTPMQGRTSQNYKMIASENDTLVQRKCGINDPINLTLTNAGDSAEIQTYQNEYCSLLSDKALMVAGLARGHATDGYGDPALFVIPPVEQYMNSIIYTTLSLASSYHSIVLPADEYYNNGVVFDGITYNYTWIQIYNPDGSVGGYGYSAAASNSHTISHTHANGKLMVNVYGWTTYGGYGFTAGMMLNPINGVTQTAEISFTTNMYSVSEGDGEVILQLQRSVEFDSNVTVQIQVTPTLEDTAIDGLDFESIDMILSFYNETLINVSIVILNNDIVEPIEYFTVSIFQFEGDIVFPITETVVAIIDDDVLTVGFHKEEFPYKDCEVTVEIVTVSGVLQDDAIVYGGLVIGVDEGDNSTLIDIEFTSVYQDHSVTVDICPLAITITDASNITAWLSVIDDSSTNVALGNDTAKILPLIPTSPAPLPTEYINITINITYTETTTEKYSFNFTETSTTQVNFTLTSTTQVNFTITETTTEELTLTSTTTEQFNFTTTETETTVEEVTVTDTSVSTTKVTTTRTVQTCTAEPFTVTQQESSCQATTSTRNDGTVERLIGDNQVAITSSSLYGVIAAIVIAFIILLLVSIVVCYTSYRCGMSKGRRLEVEKDYQKHVYDFDQDTHGLVKNEVYDTGDSTSGVHSVQNPLYDNLND